MKSQPKKRLSNQGSVTRGALQPPNGEHNSDSANTDLERSVTQYSPDSTPASSVEPKWLAGASREQRFAYDWLLLELKERGVEKPSITRTTQGVWQCRDGNKLLGRLSESIVISRDTDAVNGLFDLRSTCTVEFDWKVLKSNNYGDIFYAYASAITFAQRAVILAMMRKEHECPSLRSSTVKTFITNNAQKLEADKPAEASSYAYWVFQAAVEEWCKKQKEEFRKKLRVGSSISAFSSKSAADKYKSWLKEQAEKCPPWFKAKSFTIPEKSINLTMAGRDLTVNLNLATGVLISAKAYARGGSEWTIIRKLVSGEYQKRDARVVWDDNRHKWLLRISYSYARPRQVTDGNTIVIVPSMNSLVHMFTNEARSLPKFDSISLIGWKNRMDGRRGEIRSHFNHIGSGSRGHGTKRRYRLMTDLSEKEANFTTTWIRQQAAHVVSIAQQNGVSLVIMDDWSTPVPCFHNDRRLEKMLRRFPICSLLDAIQFACMKAGIKAIRHVCSPNCPNCDAMNDKIKPFRKWSGDQLLRCEACEAEFDEVFIRAWRVMNAHKPEASENFRRSSEQMKRVREEALELKAAAAE